MIEHNPTYRRTWMFPRNIRAIIPWKVSQITSLLISSTKKDNWSGNQSLQDHFLELLEKVGVKERGGRYSPKQGGARTYLAQLKLLGLIFQRDDKSIFTTIAGDALINASDSPSKIIRKQLLRLQFPSMYSRGKSVKIHPKIQIKPILFVLKLMMDKEIGYLSDYELCVAVIYGHSWEKLDKCKQKILSLRKKGGGLKNLLTEIDNPYEDLYTVRGKDRSAIRALADCKDIANTCKNYMQSCSLIDEYYLEGSPHKHYCINISVIDEINDELNNKNIFIDISNDEHFQRKFGVWDKKKDIRNLEDKKDASKAKDLFLVALFTEYAGEKPTTKIEKDFIQLAKSYGYYESDVHRVITPHLEHSLSYFESKFIELSRAGPRGGIDFEKATTKLFNERLGLSAFHIGQKKRRGKLGGYADILVCHESDCGLIDTKASKAYSISHDDYLKMQSTYSINISELKHYNKEKLKFALYIAGDFTNNMLNSTRLTQLNTLNESDFSFSALRAFDFLKVCNLNLKQGSKSELMRVFSSGKMLYLKDFEKVIN